MSNCINCTEIGAESAMNGNTYLCENCRPKEKNCEVCHTQRIDRHNETVRDKKSKIAKIISICNPCFRKITGVK